MRTRTALRSATLAACFALACNKRANAPQAPEALRNMAANHARALRPEPWIDRAGRMRGNWRGLGDILAGRADPERILQW